MATTSLSLGEHWEVFIKNEVASGRYGSASEVVRDALRTLEERKTKLDVLRAHLDEGSASDTFVDDFSMDELINDLDTES
ncbi:CopG family transcriptional regulator [Salinivibrio sp. MA351]|uniref:type II toxin-antitoxin system ParD family antitoxin n=1 Tax=Salinivibrio sp. MA351 TaxID=1909453 RepID=UPI000988A52C|nr:type II toxin-antitoxin system ParD family antitoxin [Salinivibrio sp. MA351]OOE99758.1 CopG family transcriptional regulator [Salinivibrio sp. MA351]